MQTHKAIYTPLTKASTREANASNKITHIHSKELGTKENPILLKTFHNCMNNIIGKIHHLTRILMC
jgi:hypothetical protein